MKTINLRDYRPQNAPLLIFFSVLALLVLVNAFAPATPQEQHTSGFIYILTTPVPTAPIDTSLAVENAQLRARVAELEAERKTVDNVTVSEPVYQVLTAPQPTPYIAHTTVGDIVVPPDATPVPEGAHYDGPFLVPQVTPEPAGAVRVCDGFGDWRDYDAAYATSPACHR